MRSSTHDPETPTRHRDRARAADLLSALETGDESVFERLVEQWSPAMLRMAMIHVERAVAEEVVQEAWLITLRTLHRYEGRSSLRTWVLGITVNVARSRGRAERRSIAAGDQESVFDGARFRPPDDPYRRHWAMGPTRWPTPEQALLSGETRRVILDAVEHLPAGQREVLVLRDLEGWPAADACNALGLSDTNQRVLLHRARTRVRKAIEDYFAATEPT